MLILLLLLRYIIVNRICYTVSFSFACYSEEILNPSIPMALRLSGILMGTFSLPLSLSDPSFLMDFAFFLLGGVVIVYERKVKLLFGKFR